MKPSEFLLQFEQTTDYPTLDGRKYFMEKLNNPEKKLKFIHVAGTNGKGSICEMLNSILINSNYKVGKFITPHLHVFNESICINNVQITDEEFEKYYPILSEIIENYKKDAGREFTRFEILTSIAILYFYEKKCDIAILEVGLGGMYDCTNIITPLISCFGSISFDHIKILGNTLEEIAIQKAGIIKENSDSVIFDQPALSTIKQVCLEKNNNLHIVYDKNISNYKFDKEYQYFTYKNNLEITLNLKGKKQIENASTVIKCIEILNNKFKFNISEIVLKNSLKNIVHPARFEIISKNPFIIYDGAHNTNAIENFINTTQNIYSSYKKTFVVSIITTKNYKEILSKLVSSFPDSKFIFTDGNNSHKFWNPELLFNEAKKFIDNENLLSIKTLENALNLNSEVNFVVGSFYSYDAVINILNNMKN